MAQGQEVFFTAHLDLSQLTRQIEQLKKTTHKINVTFDLPSNLSSSSTKIRSLNNEKIEIKVDDSQLTALNIHLDKKIAHYKQVRNYFKNNPLSVTVKSTEGDLTVKRGKSASSATVSKEITRSIKTQGTQTNSLLSNLTQKISSNQRKQLQQGKRSIQQAKKQRAEIQRTRNNDQKNTGGIKKEIRQNIKAVKDNKPSFLMSVIAQGLGGSLTQLSSGLISGIGSAFQAQTGISGEAIGKSVVNISSVFAKEGSKYIQDKTSQVLEQYLKPFKDIDLNPLIKQGKQLFAIFAPELKLVNAEFKGLINLIQSLTSEIQNVIEINRQDATIKRQNIEKGKKEKKEEYTDIQIKDSIAQVQESTLRITSLMKDYKEISTGIDREVAALEKKKELVFEKGKKTIAESDSPAKRTQAQIVTEEVLLSLEKKQNALEKQRQVVKKAINKEVEKEKQLIIDNQKLIQEGRATKLQITPEIPQAVLMAARLASGGQNIPLENLPTIIPQTHKEGADALHYPDINAIALDPDTFVKIQQGLKLTEKEFELLIHEMVHAINVGLGDLKTDKIKPIDLKDADITPDERTEIEAFLKGYVDTGTRLKPTTMGVISVQEDERNAQLQAMRGRKQGVSLQSEKILKQSTTALMKENLKMVKELLGLKKNFDQISQNLQKSGVGDYDQAIATMVEEIKSVAGGLTNLRDILYDAAGELNAIENLDNFDENAKAVVTASEELSKQFQLAKQTIQKGQKFGKLLLNTGKAYDTLTDNQVAYLDSLIETVNKAKEKISASFKEQIILPSTDKTGQTELKRAEEGITNSLVNLVAQINQAKKGLQQSLKVDPRLLKQIGQGVNLAIQQGFSSLDQVLFKAQYSGGMTPQAQRKTKEQLVSAQQFLDIEEQSNFIFNKFDEMSSTSFSEVQSEVQTLTESLRNLYETQIKELNKGTSEGKDNGIKLQSSINELMFQINTIIQDSLGLLRSNTLGDPALAEKLKQSKDAQESVAQLNILIDEVSKLNVTKDADIDAMMTDVMQTFIKLNQVTKDYLNTVNSAVTPGNFKKQQALEQQYVSLTQKMDDLQTSVQNFMEVRSEQLPFIEQLDKGEQVGTKIENQIGANIEAVRQKIQDLDNDQITEIVNALETKINNAVDSLQQGYELAGASLQDYSKFDVKKFEKIAAFVESKINNLMAVNAEILKVDKVINKLIAQQKTQQVVKQLDTEFTAKGIQKIIRLSNILLDSNIDPTKGKQENIKQILTSPLSKEIMQIAKGEFTDEKGEPVLIGDEFRKKEAAKGIETPMLDSRINSMIQSSLKQINESFVELAQTTDLLKLEDLVLDINKFIQSLNNLKVKFKLTQRQAGIIQSSINRGKGIQELIQRDAPSPQELQMATDPWGTEESSQVGKDYVLGVVEGLKELVPLLVEEGTGMAKQLHMTVEEELDIQSPSGKGKEIGKNYILGVLAGIRNEMSKIEPVVQKIFRNFGVQAEDGLLEGLKEDMNVDFELKALKRENKKATSSSSQKQSKTDDPKQRKVSSERATKTKTPSQEEFKAFFEKINELKVNLEQPELSYEEFMTKLEQYSPEDLEGLTVDTGLEELMQQAVEIQSRFADKLADFEQKVTDKIDQFVDLNETNIGERGEDLGTSQRSLLRQFTNYREERRMLKALGTGRTSVENEMADLKRSFKEAQRIIDVANNVPGADINALINDLNIDSKYVLEEIEKRINDQLSQISQEGGDIDSQEIAERINSKIQEAMKGIEVGEDGADPELITQDISQKLQDFYSLIDNIEDIMSESFRIAETNLEDMESSTGNVIRDLAFDVQDATEVLDEVVDQFNQGTLGQDLDLTPFKEFLNTIEGDVGISVASLGGILGNVGRTMGNVTQSIVEQIPFLSNLVNLFRDFFVVIALGTVLNKLKDLFSQITEGAFDAALEIENLERALGFAQGKDGAKILADLKQKSEELGISFIQLAKGYQQMTTSAIGTVMSGQIEEITMKFSESFAAMGLSAEAQEGSFLALGQMMSKGVVSAEELRQQLGERLPGALTMAAQAMGMTTEEFNNLLNSGQILSKDLLPALANQMQLRTSTILPATISSTQANLNRLQNQIYLFKTEVGDLQVTLANIGLPILNSGLEFLGKNIGFVINVLITLTVLMTGRFLTSLNAVLQGSLNAANGMKVLNGTLVFGSKILKTYGLQFLAFTAIIAGVQYIFGTLTKFINTGSKELKRYSNIVSSLSDEMKKLQEVQKDDSQGNGKMFGRSYDELQFSFGKSFQENWEILKDIMTHDSAKYAADFVKNMESINNIQQRALDTYIDAYTFTKTINIEGKVITNDLSQQSIDIVQGVLQDLRTQKAELELQFALSSQKNNPELNDQLRGEIAELQTRINKVINEAFPEAPVIDGMIEAVRQTIQFANNELLEARVRGDKGAILNYERELSELELREKQLQKTKKAINDAIAKTNELYAEQVQKIEDVRIAFANADFATEATEITNKIALAQKRLTGELGQRQYESQVELETQAKIQVELEMKTQAFKVFEEKFYAHFATMSDNTKKMLSERMGIEDIDQAIREKTLSPESISLLMNTANEMLAENLGDPNQNKAILESAEELLTLWQQIQQLQLSHVEGQINQNSSLTQTARDLRDFIRSLEDFDIQLEDYFRERKRSLEDFETQFENNQIQNQRALRDLNESFSDLQVSLRDQINDLSNQINTVAKDVERQTQVNLAKLSLDKGKQGLFSGVIDLIDEIIQSEQGIQNEGLTLEQERLQINQEVLDISRQIRGLEEQAFDLERERQQQLVDLIRSQEDFIREQEQSWRDITRTAEDLADTAKEWGIHFSDIESTLRNINESYSNFHHQLDNLINNLPNLLNNGGFVANEQLIEQGLDAVSKFNGQIDNCANIVKEFGKILGINTTAMDASANSAKKLGQVFTDFSQLQPGDIIGWDKTAKHGDEHVGLFMGDNQVMHQSAGRGYKAGIYPDLDYFKKQPGAYFVRPQFTNAIIQPQGGTSGYKAIAAQILRETEGFMKNAYWDVNQYRIGYGTEYKGTKASSYKKGDTITLQEAEAQLLNYDIPRFERVVKQAIGGAWNSITDNMKAALISIAYNKGSIPAKLAKAVKAGAHQEAEQIIRNLDKATHESRRRKEANLYSSGTRVITPSVAPTTSISTNRMGGGSLSTNSQKQLDQITKKVQTEIATNVDQTLANKITKADSKTIQELIGHLSKNKLASAELIAEANALTSLGNYKGAVALLEQKLQNFKKLKLDFIAVRKEQLEQNVIENRIANLYNIREKMKESVQTVKDMQVQYKDLAREIRTAGIESKGFMTYQEQYTQAMEENRLKFEGIRKSVNDYQMQLEDLIDTLTKNPEETKAAIDKMFDLSELIEDEETKQDIAKLINEVKEGSKSLEQVAKELTVTVEELDKIETQSKADTDRLKRLELQKASLETLVGAYSNLVDTTKTYLSVPLSRELQKRQALHDLELNYLTQIEDLTQKIAMYEDEGSEFYDPEKVMELKELLDLTKELYNNQQLKITLDIDRQGMLEDMSELSGVFSSMGEKLMKTEGHPFGLGNDLMKQGALIEVQQQYLELERTLTRIMETQAENPLFDVEQIEQYAEALSGSLVEALKQVEVEYSILGQMIQQPLQSAISSSLTDLVSGTTSMLDILKNFLNSVAQSLADYAAKIASMRILQWITGSVGNALAPGVGTLATSNASSFMNASIYSLGTPGTFMYGGEIQNFAEGGAVSMAGYLNTSGVDIGSRAFARGFNNEIGGVGAGVGATVGVMTDYLMSNTAVGNIFGGKTSTDPVTGRVFYSPEMVLGFQQEESPSINNFMSGGEIVALGIGVAQAMKREGTGAIPIVAHKGEQVLSTRNRDAQIYRSLVKSGEWNQIRQQKLSRNINNYEYGGMISTYRQTFNNQNKSQNFQTKDQQITYNMNITTPNADSFRKSRSVIAQEEKRRMEASKRFN